ncbi:hypothetical protein Y032_0004g2199 [Ancylostoma ceylanicum]|uniref:Nucleoporin Nup133/Nup155-like N-terminal domain-containing protein n=1 Tax=Ancylostoma ceylanicum TaxID=53326 RepID=A0A016VXP2_9BILA|nr:hypothetical protein Y032_0004g2199 [Ancylostoma ceylanicum]
MSTSFIETMGGDSIESAAQRVASHIENTIDSADIYNKLTQNGSCPVSGLGDRFYSKGGLEFVLKRRIPMPEELSYQIRNMRSQFSMGLFPEISRAWVVIDSDIFMWNYDTNDDLAYFDAVENTVLKIALVRVKSDVFASHITHGLVVGTVTDLSLYPVIMDIDPATGRPGIAIDANHFFKIALDNASLNDIVSTNDGRVFFTADDKLYEFVYEHNTGWFGGGRRCRVVNQSVTLLSTLIPFLGPGSEELEQIALDKSRNILYCLGKNGSIQVFDLGVDGAQCSRVCVVTAGQIASEAHLMTQYGHDESTFTNIATICALEAEQSNQLNLVAVTTKGVRIYFSVLARNISVPNPQGQYLSQITYKSLSQQEVRPQCLRVAHVRFSPGVAPTSIYRDTPQGVSIAYADQSICVMATANRQLVWALSDLYHPHAKVYCESMNDLQVAGNVWAITPVLEKALHEQPPEPGMIARVQPHSFFRQLIETKQRLIICSNEGIHEFDYVTPREALREALFDGGAEGRATMQLWQQFGATEVLVLALSVLTSEAAVDERIKDKAASMFYSFKDGPELVDAEQIRGFDSTWSPGDSLAEWKYKMRSPLHASTPRFENYPSGQVSSPFSPTMSKPLAGGGQGYQHSPSRRHDALYYYFSRLVTPIWNHAICRVKSGALITSLSSAEMDWLSAELRKLGQVMEKYGLLPKPDVTWNNTAVAKLNVQASNLERQSLIALRKLIESSAELLSLWSTANSFDLKAISASMDPAILPTLAGRPFCHLVCDGQHLSGDLIRAMIKYFLGDEAGTKDLSEKLRALCPNLYSKDDACVTNAMEQLKLASLSNSGAARQNLVEKACDLFRQSIGKVSLPVVCRSLADLGAFEQLANLCLLKAKRDDPKQLAVLAYHHGRAGEDREIQAAEKRRAESYKCLTDTLDDLEAASSRSSPTSAESAVNCDLVISCITSSDDELAHAALFRWMLERNKANLILQSKSPYVEQFLTHEISTGRGQRYLDLLWRFYEKAGHYDKAAMLLSRLADNENEEISLSQRFAYLSHAIICAQAGNDPKTKAMIQELRDKVEVAHIQLAIKECMDIRTPKQQELVKLLDGPILSLQMLLEKFAAPYGLHKVQLAIFHCANLYSEEPIMAVWENILQSEFKYEGEVSERLLCTLHELYAIYGSTKYFPRNFILRRLLEMGSGLSDRSRRGILPASFFVSLITKLELGYVDFIEVLSSEYRTGDPWWTQNEAGQRYIMEVGIAVVQAFLDSGAKFTPMERNFRAKIAAICDSCVSMFSLDARAVSSQHLLQLDRHFSALHLRLTAMSS